MNRNPWIHVAVVVLLLGLTSLLLVGQKNRQRLGKPGVKLVDRPSVDQNGNAVGTQSVALPERAAEYSECCPTNSRISMAELKLLPPDTTYGRKRFRREDGFWFDTSVVLMGADRTSIHKPEICLTGQGWKHGAGEVVSIPMDRPHPYDLKVMKIIGSQTFKVEGREVELKAVYAYWFVSADRLTPRHKERFWISLQDLVTKGVMPRWAYISCFAWCEPGQEEAVFVRMKNFISSAVPEFQLVSEPRFSSTPPRTAAAW